MKNKDIDVFGIGNPLIDLMAYVSADFLKAHGLQKDRMYLVDAERQKKLMTHLEAAHTEIFPAPGGSCANSMIGVCQLGGKAAYGGKIGQDSFGHVYKEKLAESGVVASLGETNGLTGSSLVLVMEDASRTMNTHLGVAQQFASSDIDEALLKRARYLYIEGYLWDTEEQKKAILETIGLAQKHGVQISLSLSDPLCVQRHQEEFNHLLKECVDLVFCNEEEAFVLTNRPSAQEALKDLSTHVETVVMTLGEKGALISHCAQPLFIDPVPTKAHDTTGAGDAFAAGFLYGITQKKSALDSGKIAVAMASLVIGQLGPRFQGNVSARMQELLGG